MAGLSPAFLAPPDEQTQDAGLVANVVDPAALGASQVLPAPPPPAPVANLPPDALMAAASAPPPAFPDTPVDAALAPALPTQGGPALSALPPPAIVPSAGLMSPVEAAKGLLGRTDEVGKELEAAATEKSGLEAQQATERDEFARQRETALKALQDRQEMHRARAASDVASARSKAETEPYHTFWESRNIAQNVATAFGLILGGVSWNAGHVNRGVDLLKHAMDQDLALQKEKHGDLWKAVEAAERGERALDQRELRETAAFSAAQGAKWDAIASRLGAMIAANKGKGDVATAKKVQLEAYGKAVAGWQNAESAEAAAAHLKEMDEEAKRHHLEQERASMIRALKYKTKGEGGSGGGGARDAAVIELKGKIAELQKSGLKGVDLSQAVDKEAVRLKIPLVGKPNTVNARSIMADVGKGEAQEGLSDVRDLKVREAEDARTVMWKGKPFLAPRAAQVKDIAKDIANMEKYTDLIREVADDIRRNGFIIDPGGEHNPQREKAKHRMTLMAEVQALGRQISALQATDAGQKLEHQMIGQAGVGLKPGMASPHVLEDLAKRAQKLIETKLGAMLQPRDKAVPAGGGKLPPGAVPGTKKSTGQKGYMLDGKFTPFEADIVL